MEGRGHGATLEMTEGATTVPNNLPAELSPFIGRFDAVDRGAKLVLGNRLVTITGAGGAGKTRLAQRVAGAIADGFPDGVWWVDLLGVADPDLVPSAISRAASLTEDSGDRLGGIVRRLANTRSLLVLDNCEHVLDAAAEAAAAILTGCPSASVLTTSRTPLNVPGELSWRLPPMGDDDAVQLFVDRASRMGGTLTVEDDVAAVARICSKLEGVPLAIELAAARSRVLSLGQIHDGLTDAIALLSSAQRGVRPRHQTIDASIRWSHSLLTADEQLLFRRLGVFESPFTLDAAVAVAPDRDLAAHAVLGLLESLVDQSLVQVDRRRHVARFRLLETVRQFARRELEEAGEREAVAARHAAYFAGRGRMLWPLFEPNMADLLEQGDDEYEDLAAMLNHLERHASPEEHAEIAAACLPALSVRRTAEAAALGERAAARLEGGTEQAGRLHLQLALVEPNMFSHVERAIAAAQATGLPELTAQADYWAASRALSMDPTPDAVASFDATRRRLAELGENHFSKTHWVVAASRRALGRVDEATQIWEVAKSETVCKRCNVMVWSEGALLALARGDLGAARRAVERANAEARVVRDDGFTGRVRLAEAAVAAYAGEMAPSGVIDEGVALGHATENPMVIGYFTEARGVCRLAAGDAAGAEADFGTAIDFADEMFAKRTEARVGRAAARHATGDLAGAAQVVSELRALAARWDAGPWLLSQVELRAGALALDTDRVGEADDLAHRALSDAWLGPWPPLVVNALELLASIAVSRESNAEAARLYGAAARQRDEIGYRLGTDPERSRLERDLQVARDRLGDDFDRAVDEGWRLSLNEAVAYARRARGERRRPSHGWDGLTPTERDVAGLAVQGLTNAEIAERLFIGRETVKTHLSNVYAKVGVANRTQLVADAARRGIT